MTPNMTRYATLALSLFLVIPISRSQQNFSLPEWVKVRKDIPYDQYPQTVLDVYIPSKKPERELTPCVVAIHGGGWRSGSREGMLPHCLRYLEKGAVVVNVEYRLSTVAPAPAAVQDVLKAVRWVSENANEIGCNADKIVVTGPSAGGHLALMAGLLTEDARLGPVTKVAAVINLYGPTDLMELLTGPGARPSVQEWIPQQPGRLELARKLSPVSYIRAGVPPVLTVHGTADPVVPYEQGTRLTRLLRDAGADAELIPVVNGKHGFPEKDWDWIYQEIFDWLKRKEILSP